MNTGGTPDIIIDEEHRVCSRRPPRSWRTTFGGFGSDEPLRARLGAGAQASLPQRNSTRPLSIPQIERLYRRSDGDRALTPPRRVAVVARSVFPLHGLGGLERSVYDLVRYLARAGAGGDADHAPADARPVHRMQRAWHHDQVRHVPDLPACGPARHHGPRSKHRVSAVWRACRAASPGRSSKDGHIDVVHGFGASVLGLRAAAIQRRLRRSC